MKKFLLLSLLFCSAILSAQDKTLQATAYYNKAEAAYNSNSFEEAVNYLKQAEEILGSPNPKTLYLKIQALNELTKNSSAKIAELKQAIAIFYQIVDQDNYPVAKYLDVTTIEVDLKEREQRIKQRDEQEEAFFEKVKASNDFDDLNTFLSRYPNSKFIPKLSDKINALREHNEQLKAEEERKKLEEKKSAKPQGFYMNLGFALQNLHDLEQPMGVNFLAKGVSFDLGFKIFKSKNLDKKFRVGFDLGLIHYTFAVSNNYNYTRYDEYSETYNPTSGRAALHTLQFLKMGPALSWNLKKSQHYLYVTPQLAGNFSIYNIPGRDGSHTRSTGIMGMGATGCFKVEYLYRKLLIGVKYQYNFLVDFDSEQLVGGHQIIIPSIGVKF